MFVLGELSDVEVLGHAAVNVVGVENHDFSPGGEGQEKEAQGRKEADQALTDDTVHDFSSSSMSLLALHGCEKTLLSLYDGDVHLSIYTTGESLDLMALRKKPEESPSGTFLRLKGLQGNMNRYQRKSLQGKNGQTSGMTMADTTIQVMTRPVPHFR
jgi:hypothetical protein